MMDDRPTALIVHPGVDLVLLAGVRATAERLEGVVLVRDRVQSQRGRDVQGPGSFMS